MPENGSVYAQGIRQTGSSQLRLTILGGHAELHEIPISVARTCCGNSNGPEIRTAARYVCPVDEVVVTSVRCSSANYRIKSSGVRVQVDLGPGHRSTARGLSRPDEGLAVRTHRDSDSLTLQPRTGRSHQCLQVASSSVLTPQFAELYRFWQFERWK